MMLQFSLVTHVKEKRVCSPLFFSRWYFWSLWFFTQFSDNELLNQTRCGMNLTREEIKARRCSFLLWKNTIKCLFPPHVVLKKSTPTFFYPNVNVSFVNLLQLLKLLIKLLISSPLTVELYNWILTRILQRWRSLALFTVWVIELLIKSKVINFPCCFVHGVISVFSP